MSVRYDPIKIQSFYDDLGENEWERLDADPRARVIFHVHKWYLEKFIKASDHVLEAGAGPGRFTIELAKLGAEVTVGDISPRQLELNRLKVEEAGYGAEVVQRVKLDILDCSQFPSEKFDAVVCYGSPLSYLLDRADEGLREILRVTKRGGYVLLSVTSALNTYLPWFLELASKYGREVLQRFVETGEVEGEVAAGHPMRSYRWSQLQALLESQSVEVVAVSASNFLATVESIPALLEIEKDSSFWEAFLGWELDFCKEPGALDCGSHIIVVIRRL
jgi:ubiquinone/menaquinone biosynthesis C-methylase UbiE